MDTGRKASLWQACLSYFASSTNELFPDNRRILFLFYNVLMPNATANLSKTSRNKRHSNVFKGVICDASAYTVIVSFCCSTGTMYQKNYILISYRLYIKNVSGQCNVDCSSRTSAGSNILVHNIRKCCISIG